MDEELDGTTATLKEAMQISKKGTEYWMARELMKILKYPEWRYFKNVIEKAMKACEGVGEDINEHFGETTKMVTVGSGAKVQVQDYYLNRYACYLIAMNGNPQNIEIAKAQTYFAVQTRRQEIQEKLTEEERRLLLRNRVKDANNKLKRAAKDAGVKMYGVFQDAGYRGLYGGMSLTDLKAFKKLDKKDQLLDRIGRTELAANEFRITQTEDRLVRDKVNNEPQAIRTHREVGEEVRRAIQKIGGTMPEKLPIEPPIKEIERKLKQETKELHD
ncbi:MAG TPA: DNA damage-inducible protein D [Candidatus Aquicultor sp.]|jgi:DNA-damage-inducible protein D